MSDREVAAAVDQLVGRFGLPRGAADRLLALVACVAGDHHAPTSVREPLAVVDQHLADSLVALELGVFDSALEAVDLGSGAGFPGLPLAIARPQSQFVLLESNRRKSAFIGRAAAAAGAGNVLVANARAEAWPEGIGRFGVATARAVAALDVLIEYAAPLLSVGGRLIAWRGRRDAAVERAAERAAAALGMEVSEVVAVTPFASAQTRYLHVISKLVETPSGFPRRPGVAAKRPLSGRT